MSYQPGGAASAAAIARSAQINGFERNVNYQPPKKKRKAKADVVYSQPLDTGIGSDVRTQVISLTNRLKAHGGPMSLETLNLQTNNALARNPELLRMFEAHERVEKNSINGLYTYRLEHEAVASRDDLLREVKTHSRRAGGISIKTLKESWNGAPEVIEELEKEGLVLVTRTNKDEPKMVFWNDLTPQEAPKVEGEFRAIFDGLKWPGNDTDLIEALHRFNQTPARTTAAPVAATNPNKKKGKKKASRVNAKQFMNSHIAGLDQDYPRAPPPPS